MLFFFRKTNLSRLANYGLPSVTILDPKIYSYSDFFFGETFDRLRQKKCAMFDAVYHYDYDHYDRHLKNICKSFYSNNFSYTINCLICNMIPTFRHLDLFDSCINVFEIYFKIDTMYFVYLLFT